ncbi:glycerol-3-phosphate dehydrogenase [Aquincola sp. S2]|uniref:Glycerol-3-phosphate dehydrogenase n=1 Tax=Pseudaquabacterium terrae TaxID=2732868 RepID=A0ABX2ELX7_9BURK|nr:glycerol-3-phosphate dehydrogenase [Aquabacterium terrae]NRF69599.1 glycerol-3-phosphate dehydrogenase [Aquabacterium terrae]
MRHPASDPNVRLHPPPAAGVAPAVPAVPAVPAACDVLVVGGGINGVGIARDLAGRGLSVVLAEREDLAQHTSSASTKLIHGGLRYLEYYEFSLVRKALAEREGLLRGAPHIMRPLRIVMPHDPSMRPAWMLRAGLFLYDHLAKREMLPGSNAVDLRRDVTGAALKKHYTKGFVYSDGWVDDARLVVLCAIDAVERGATVLTRCAVTSAMRGAAGAGWTATLQSEDGSATTVKARAVVNAAGPWAERFLREQAQQQGVKSLRLVKGSHIVVPKLFDHDHAYIFQNPDKRIIFVQPYEGDFTLIGTTDVEHNGAIGAARIDEDEVRYLCEQSSRYFDQPIRPADVVWSYSGVRPLIDDESSDAAAVTRDYLLELDTAGGAPLLNVWGGKLTTFRLLGEEAADLLAGPLQAKKAAWTHGAVLPGGDLSRWIGPPNKASRPDADLRRFVQALQRRYPVLPEKVLARWARLYGARVELLMAGGAPGAEVAPGVYEAELRYLAEHEWARSADDILWRRTKLGLHLDDAQRARISAWCDEHLAAPGRDGKATLERAWN